MATTEVLTFIAISCDDIAVDKVIVAREEETLKRHINEYMKEFFEDLIKEYQSCKDYSDPLEDIRCSINTLFKYNETSDPFGWGMQYIIERHKVL